jgi:hypothetical protein
MLKQRHQQRVFRAVAAMSTPEPSPVTIITIEPWLADVLRRQTLVTQKVNHHAFARLRDLEPAAQFALAGIYRDAYAVMEAIGWEPDPDCGPVDVPLTAGHIEQLYRRRYELGALNFERLDALAEAPTAEAAATIRADIEADRLAAQALDRLFAEYDRAVST